MNFAEGQNMFNFLDKSDDKPFSAWEWAKIIILAMFMTPILWIGLCLVMCLEP